MSTSVPVGGTTGHDHESTAAIDEAARWYACLPASDRIKRPAVPLLKENFGLTASEAIETLREASLIRARAL